MLGRCRGRVPFCDAACGGWVVTYAGRVVGECSWTAPCSRALARRVPPLTVSSKSSRAQGKSRLEPATSAAYGAYDAAAVCKLARRIDMCRRIWCSVDCIVQCHTKDN